MIVIMVLNKDVAFLILPFSFIACTWANHTRVFLEAVCSFEKEGWLRAAERTFSDAWELAGSSAGTTGQRLYGSKLHRKATRYAYGGQGIYASCSGFVSNEVQ